MENMKDFERKIEIAERNSRAWEYIRRSQKNREMVESLTFPKWFNFVLAFSAIGCGFIWANIAVMF